MNPTGDPKRYKWRPKEPRRPQDASDTSEEGEGELYRQAAPFEVKLRLGPITYGQDVSYYDDNQPALNEASHLQKLQAASDPSLIRKDKKGRIIKPTDKLAIAERTQKKKERYERRKTERRQEKKVKQETRKSTFLEDIEGSKELEQAGLPLFFGRKPIPDTYSDEEVNSTLKRQKVDNEPVESRPSAVPLIVPVGPMPAAHASDANSDGTNESDYGPVDVEPVFSDIPMTHLANIEGHIKALTDIDVDKTESRLITGGLDYKVKLWDFLQMDEQMIPYRSFEPIDSHPIRSCRFDMEARYLLICAGNFQPKLFTKEGRLVFECVRGDVYMADMLHTKGHVKIVTECVWHPTEKLKFASSSHDGTCRTWDFHGRLVGLDQQLGHKSVHKARTTVNTRVGVNCCAWAPNGKMLVGGCADGSIQVWDADRGHSYFPSSVVYNAHKLDGDITCVKFFSDNTRLLSRAQDHTLKLWDLRQFSHPVHTWENLLNINLKTQVDLSPNDRYIVTGTSSVRNEGQGHVVVYDSNDLTLVGEAPVCQGSVCAVKWVEGMEQIMTGGSDGSLNVLYSPSLSRGGVVDCLKRKAKVDHSYDLFLEKPIVTPYSLPQFKGNYQSKKKERERKREDPMLSQKPKEPIFAPNKDGKMVGLTTVTQYVLRSIHEKRRPDDDPREEILSYHIEAEEKPEWIQPIYNITQPKATFDLSRDTFEEKEYLSRMAVPKCQSCGLKFCSCPKRRVTEEPVFSADRKIA